ncbi:Nif3-like dinuclear metal center hexameric protein [Lacticaseibacillus hulanensis]|uniref:Nif3-like dinuclear metal center hexameric protein n=1 Tax=Lacticaseibacillus hulanensis TaxID=2493111 RepID=UPI000FDC264B|nr:Nif3-like dinuclear metal center hexameric protein [Lacticaseibacillus hulanensis]
MTDTLTIVRAVTDYAPAALAVPGDPIGWQLGDPHAVVNRVLVSLDVRPSVVQEAIDGHFDLIVAHHPLVFRPAHNLDERNPQNAMYANLLRHNIGVFGAHTNLDNANPGMNDWLSADLHLTNVRPFIDAGELQGMGRIGELPHALTLRELAAQCKTVWQLTGLRAIAKDLDKPVRTVAILGGSGADVYPDAAAAGADVLITGDVSYHTGHDILESKVAVLDVGHHVEHVMKKHLAAILQERNLADGWNVTIVPSTLNTDPFTFL